MADYGMNLPTDALVEILLRLPTSSRRRFRLVCKQWRDLIDKRTPERQVRTKILAFIGQFNGSLAHVFDDDGKDAFLRHTWTFASPHGHVFIGMVGTCNGLLCLTEVHPRNGRVLVVVTNPVTGEKAKLPPLPPSAGTDVSVCRDLFSFGYHPTTGRYKVVHVSCCPETDGSLLVFTLGHDRSWRELPLPTPPEPHGYKRNGVVSVDGSTYWLTKGRRSVMALNLEDDSITSFDAPLIGLAEKPVQVSPDCQLTNVQARLGVVVSQRSVLLVTMDVYVLEGGGEQPRWSLNYTVVEQIALHGGHWIVAPCFTHGEYVLSQPADRRLLYRQKVRDLEDRGGKKTQLRPLEKAELVTKETERYREAIEPFAYVETLEPVPAILGV